MNFENGETGKQLKRLAEYFDLTEKEAIEFLINEKYRQLRNDIEGEEPSLELFPELEI